MSYNPGGNVNFRINLPNNDIYEKNYNNSNIDNN